MRKKFTMLFAALLACVGVMKAQIKTIGEIGENITDLNELKEDSYVIFKNVGRNGYVYEQSSDKLMKLGNEAVVGAGSEYIWQVHVEEGEKYSFSSVTGNYISTPLDGGNVYTVTNDDSKKDKFTITKHSENNANWKLQSSNNTNIYWDGQGADGSHRFVGWLGSGNNSQYQIIPISVQESYSLTVLYCRNQTTVHSEEAIVPPNHVFNITAPIFTTIASCTADKCDAVNNNDGTYSCTISEHNTTITVDISEPSLDLTQTYRLKNVASGLYMTIVTENAEGIQLKGLSDNNDGQTFAFIETMTKNGYEIKSESKFYLTANGAWNYIATENTSTSSIHIIEEVENGIYRLKSINGYVASNENAIADGSPMYSNHPESRNTNTWEFVPTSVSPEKILQEEMSALKAEAEQILSDLPNITEDPLPFTNAKSNLVAAITKATEYAESTDIEQLNSTILELRNASASIQRVIFQSGVLTNLEAGEYIVYYKDQSGKKHYLKNEGNRVKSTIHPTVYDIANGTTDGGYVEYAYHFNMNRTNISNPTNDQNKEIQTDTRTRTWDSQVLYVNNQGKYAIRSTNCPANSGWNSDAFITVSEDGATVYGQNTDLSDALYIWNIEKVTAEAEIAGVKYATLQGAIEAAEAEETVKLLNDITLTEDTEINKVVFLDLNGKTINGEGSIRGIHYIINDADYKTNPYSMSADKKNINITYNRTFGHTNWQVLYVPFAIPVANMSEFDVYSITGVDNKKNAVVVEKITEGTLKAHTPYLIKASETGNKAITVEGATLMAAPQENKTWAFGGYTFTGTYAPKPISESAEYVLTNGEWRRLNNNDQTLGAFRVYLTVDGASAPELRITTRGEEDTTAIDNAEFNAQPSAVIYDLLGRRVEKMDKGIYIVNGKKIVVK